MEGKEEKEECGGAVKWGRCIDSVQYYSQLTVDHNDHTTMGRVASSVCGSVRDIQRACVQRHVCREPDRGHGDLDQARVVSGGGCGETTAWCAVQPH